MAGFPNPLPDTLHLLLVGFCVRVCVWSCRSLLARLRVPVLVALLVVYVSRPHLYTSFALTDYACANCIVLV